MTWRNGGCLKLFDGIAVPHVGAGKSNSHNVDNNSAISQPHKFYLEHKYVFKNLSHICFISMQQRNDV